jgi:uncharacterized protein (TIGR02594 family)
MKWMDIAWQQEGADIREIGGRAANGSILEYFRANGRAEVTSDEVPWCAAAYFYCLRFAGINVDAFVKGEDILLAWSATKVGTRLTEPRVGCGCVMTRRDASGKVVGHHVGFVVSWTKTTLKLLGGNQANSFNVSEFKRRSDMIFMWPEPPATVDQVAETSRIADAAGDVRKDAAKVGGTQGLENAVPAPPQQLPGVETIAEHAGSFKSTVLGLQDFLLFAWGKAWWIAAALAVYWLIRMAWNAGWIRWWRTEDYNVGNGKAPATAPPPASPDLEEASLV